MEKTKQLVIIGIGETAEIAYQYFTYDSIYEVIAFSAETTYLDKEELFGLPIVPFENLETVYSPEHFEVFVAVSYTQLNRLRTRLYKAAKQKGFNAASYISSRAFVWRDVEVGENCFVFENNVLQYKVKVEDNVILWSGNHIGHRSVIRENCFLSSHVVVSGYCEVGESSFMGVNSCLADNTKVAKDCVIGAGAVVLKSTEEGKVYQGNPAEAAKVSSLRLFKVKER